MNNKTIEEYNKAQREIAKLLDYGMITEQHAITLLLNESGHDFGGSQNNYKIIRDLLDEIKELEQLQQKQTATAYFLVEPEQPKTTIADSIQFKRDDILINGQRFPYHVSNDISITTVPDFNIFEVSLKVITNQVIGAKEDWYQ